MTPASQPDLAASLAGRYAIERELGRGGMATVFLVADLKHGRPMALKVLHPELGNTVGPERFRREIMVVAKLQHPHILTVHDSGETATGQLWFTMPYVDGESLRARIRREGQLPAGEAIRITREAALALQYAHEHGVVHRDIKPENILLDHDGNTLIADFGVARALDGVGGGATDSGPTLTATGVAIGTPAYMSPEQASGERAVDARTDIYALGTVLYEMLAGEPPFTGGSAQAIIAKRFAIAAPPVSVLRDGLAPGLVAAVATALARSPVDRWVSAAAFSDALVQVTDPGRAARAASRRVPAWGVVLGVVLSVVVLMAAIAFIAWRARQGSAVPVGPVGLRAVLPFDNEGDSANRYFADGITDEIRGKLSAIPALRLIASASANQYRHTTKPQEQIGRELGVRYLLTGRIQWEESANGVRRVRVSPELVEVRQGGAAETRWQQSYDTTLADVFEVQSAVATRVADKMGVVLSQPRAGADGRAADPERRGIRRLPEEQRARRRRSGNGPPFAGVGRTGRRTRFGIRGGMGPNIAQPHPDLRQLRSDPCGRRCRAPRGRPRDRARTGIGQRLSRARRLLLQHSDRPERRARRLRGRAPAGPFVVGCRRRIGQCRSVGRRLGRGTPARTPG